MFWIVNCNTSICRIYAYNKPDHMTLLKEINHPENKLKNSDLVSDRPGHYQSGTVARGAYSPDTDPKQVKIIDFLKEVAKELDHGRNDQAYNNLIIIAAPQTSGLLTQQLNKHVNNLISNHIHKDMIHLTEQELLHFIKENAQYPDS
jgi:protein required for attachment to host cells